MISGTVTGGREAIVELVVLGPGGRSELIEAVVDTGFNGYLTIPPSLTARLALPLAGSEPARLADGGLVSLDFHRATVLWDGKLRDVLSIAADNDPLIGMALLDGFRLTLDAVLGGPVTIEPLP